MKPHSGYSPVESKFPFRGLATSYPPNRIPPEYSPDLLNVTIRDGIVRRRAGYAKLGQTLDGVVLGITEFAKIGSSDVTVVFTSLAQYYYDAANDVWVDISIETPWTYSIVTVPSTTTLTVAEDLTTASNHMDVGTHFVIHGSVSNDGTYTVVTAAASPTLITFTPALADASDTTGNVIVSRRETITGANAGADIFTVGIDTTGFMSVGDTIYVNESASNDGVYTISAISFGGGTTSITVDQDFASSSTSGRITHRVDRVYSEGDIVNFETAVDIDFKRLIMTNGVDNPIQWFGDTAGDEHFLRWSIDLASFSTMNTIKVFKEHLMLGGVNAADNEPQLMAWSDTGKFGDFSDGNSGSQLLYELTTGIQQLVNLGDRVIVYSKDAIASGIFVGGTFIFAFETVIPEGIRLASSKAIVSINVGHVYASEENFYMFDGSRGLRTLADTIRTDYKALKDQDTIYKMASINDFSKRTIFVAVPTQDTLGIIYSLEYDSFNLAQRVWAKERYVDVPRAFGFWTNTVSYTWEDTTIEKALAVTLGNANGGGGVPALHWEDEVGSWANEGQQADFPVRIFGDASGNVYSINEGVISDNGTNSPGFFETGDFTVPEEFLSTFGRWGEVEFEAKGDDVKVSIVHEGVTTVVEAVLSLDGNMDTYRLPVDVTSRSLRVRFDFDKYFELRWVKSWVKEGAPR